MDYQIGAMHPEDWEQVSAIYLQGIRSGKATFQTEIPSWQAWDGSHLSVCRLVARSGNTILGWAALSPTSSRQAYAGVVEVSIYTHEEYHGCGVGTALLAELIIMADESGFWTLQSVIIRENTASIGLHKKCGFREVGIREKIARMGDGTWHDSVLMERRSTKVGRE